MSIEHEIDEITEKFHAGLITLEEAICLIQGPEVPQNNEDLF